MKLDYRQPDATVNVSKVSPLKRAVQLFLGLSVTFVTIYVVLGVLVNILAPKIPMSLEQKMGSAILNEWTVGNDNETVNSYKDILVKLVGEEVAATYTIMILEEAELNAFAIPGNIVGVTTGFVEEITDEEMIAFALGHELGHFENRDHIKSYGRLFVLYTMVNTLTGSDGSLATAFLDLLSKTETKFSQVDELRADVYGAALLYDTYGSYDGGIDFFNYLSEDYDGSHIVSYFESHPHPEKRVQRLMDMTELE